MIYITMIHGFYRLHAIGSIVVFLRIASGQRKMFGRIYIDDAWGHAPTTHRRAQSLRVLKRVY